MRRIVLGALGLLLVAAIGFGTWARLFAGGPVDRLPGGALDGELVTELPADWDFARDYDYLYVESRAGRLPYSTSTWFMVHEGRIHVLLPSFFVSGLEERLARDPRVRIRLGHDLYDLVAVPVHENRGPILAVFLRRQMAVEISGEVREVARPEGELPVGMKIFRLDPPPGRPGPPGA